MNVKQKNTYYATILSLVLLFSAVVTTFLSPNVSADAASDYCGSFGYTGDNLRGCIYGFNTASKENSSNVRDKCASAGFANEAGSNTSCAVGAGIPGNTSLASGAQQACESVGYYGTYLENCIKSYNANGGKSDAEIKKACGDTGNTCYVGAKLKTTDASKATAGSSTTVQDYCERIYKSGDAKDGNQSAQLAACKAGQSGKGCNTYTTTAEKTACQEGTKNNGKNGVGTPGNTNVGGGNECGGAKTNLIPCEGSGVDAIGGVLKMILTIMSVGVGVLAVGGFVYAAILYASAQDNAGQTKKAIEIITNVVIGLLLYLFMVAIVNWLVPGGVIG